MDLKNKELTTWLKNAPKKLFPQGKKEEYFTHYHKLKLYLEDNVHKEVTIGANLKDPTILLNDHGVEHINTVISRASYLVSNCNCVLTPYEVYILLCCIELHDVGNIFGRYNHELNVEKIMKEARGICGRDTIEAMIIKRIAESHGGKLADGNKDKISILEESTDTIYGTLRVRLLAGILRFSDELADDRTRSYITLLKSGSLPKQSEVFHAYAMCLESVKISHPDSSIYLRFNIPIEFLEKKFGKLDEEVFLIDEIFQRLMKMHLEKIYCMRFTKGHIDIENIRVHISFYNSESYSDDHKLIFDIKENGYPTNKTDIYQMCPELIDNGTKMDGKYFVSKIIKKNEESI